MPRERANIRIDMWSDEDWRNLTMGAQHLYKQLLSHPTLNYAGVADWRPGRLAASTKGRTADDVRRDAEELKARFFIYWDDDTEEVLVRSFVRHDGLLKQPKLPISMANDYAGIASNEIRRIFAFELQRKRREDPDLALWGNPKVITILKASSTDMKDVCRGFAEDYDRRHAEGYGEEIPNGTPTGRANETDSPAMHTATTTATSTSNEVDTGVQLRNYDHQGEVQLSGRDLKIAGLKVVNDWRNNLERNIKWPAQAIQELTAQVTVNLQDGIDPDTLVAALDRWASGGYPAKAFYNDVVAVQRERSGLPGHQPRRATGTDRAIAALAIDTSSIGGS